MYYVCMRLESCQLQIDVGDSISSNGGFVASIHELSY